jgi:prolyl oligopeptidase
VAYFEHPDNADEATLHVLNVETRRESAIDTIPGLRYTYPSWAHDDSGFYYLWLPSDESIPPNELIGHGEVRFHRLRQAPRDDDTIFPATGNPTEMLSADVSYDGSFLFVYKSSGWSKNAVFVKDQNSGGEFRRLTPDVEAQYSVATYRDQLFITTNEGAPRFRVFSTDREHLEREAWRELVPESESAVLQEAHVVGRHLVLRYLKNAYTELQLRDLSGRLVHTLKLPDIGTATTLYGEEDDDEAYFEFSSFNHPREIYEFDVAERKQSLYYRANVPVNPDDFEVRQEWFSSKDGTRVPMFIVLGKHAGNGPRRTLLSGYGGFDVDMLPQFNSTLFPWLEQGGIFALPNLRGGGEFGREWHEAGRGHNKQNVFDDFIAAAEHLIGRGYTTRQGLGISGRSNGGLLVGAAMTQRPALFGAVLCGVPVLDMLRYQRVGIGSAWIPEYGDVSNESDFRTLFAYSPYHHVDPHTHYPPTLVLSADADDRVDPMHARKFVARLLDTPDAEAFLRIEHNAGHGGADRRQQLIDRTADEYAFLLSELSP